MLIIVNSKNKMLKNRPSPPDASTEPENHKTNSRVKNQKKTYQKKPTDLVSVSKSNKLRYTTRKPAYFVGDKCNLSLFILKAND